MAGLSEAVAIATGGLHSCALLRDGNARCWGINSGGQLGNATTTNSPVPVPVAGLTGAVAIAAGSAHSCALLGDGTARCWGSNSGGQLGNATTTTWLVPVPVAGLSGAVAIAAGSAHSCALLGDGTARCWGSNSGGQARQRHHDELAGSCAGGRAEWCRPDRHRQRTFVCVVG